MTEQPTPFLEYSGGLAIAFIGGRVCCDGRARSGNGAAPGNSLRNVFVHVAQRTAWVTLSLRPIGMGQGVRSTLPALLADEDWARTWGRSEDRPSTANKKYGDSPTDPIAASEPDTD